MIRSEGRKRPYKPEPVARGSDWFGSSEVLLVGPMIHGFVLCTGLPLAFCLPEASVVATGVVWRPQRIPENHLGL